MSSSNSYASYFTGLMKSVKEYFGYENLEVENSGASEDQVETAPKEEQRQSLWKQLSGFIGKDVTSLISLPVWVFEPLSFLQIMCEPLQYVDLLHKATESNESVNRLGYLVAFITAGYSCAVRTKKPFNPILGETFEYISEDNRWNFFAEQVSHHPPIGVATASSDAFRLHLEMELQTKFRGNSSDVAVLGMNRFEIPKFGDLFSWGHMETCAHNVIIGGMWVDHYGILEVKNHTIGDRAELRFTKTGWLGAGRFDMSADIFDDKGNLRLKLAGRWNEVVHAVKVNRDGSDSVPIVLWKKPNKAPPNQWGWSPFVKKMNSLIENHTILPSDSRFREDRLALERNDLELASKEKHRLEEKQRAEKKLRDQNGEIWVPSYFQKALDEKLNMEIWRYCGHYWEDKGKKQGTKQISNERTDIDEPASSSGNTIDTPALNSIEENNDTTNDT